MRSCSIRWSAFSSATAWAELPAFGVTPCPVTIFTFGVLLLATRRVPVVLLVVPLLWSLIGGSAAFLLDIPQDWLLLVSGVVTLILIRRIDGARTTDENLAAR